MVTAGGSVAVDDEVTVTATAPLALLPAASVKATLTESAPAAAPAW